MSVSDSDSSERIVSDTEESVANIVTDEEASDTFDCLSSFFCQNSF